MKQLTEILMYALFALAIGALSAWPPYQSLEEDRAIISLVFSHAGQRIGECKRFTQEEMNKLPPNMRKPADCPRERHPVRVELRSGDQVLYSETLLPSGIWSDGKSNVYKRIEVAASNHDLFVGINDTGGAAGFDYSRTVSMQLQPGRNLVVQFDEELQEILIR